MKFSHVVFCIFAGIVGVLFGGLFFGLILDKFFDGKIEVGDMATWSAAFGTICTLGFLINQHSQLRAEQKREKKEREAHEKKQQEMWNQQQEMLTFEKYQKHKSAFHSVLERLEIELAIKFYDKEALYESLFPHNSFESCSTNNANIDFLNEVTESYVNIWTYVKEINTSKDTRLSEPLLVKLITSIPTLASSIKVQIQETHKAGNLYWSNGTPQVMCNIFNPSESILVLEAVIKRISSFCHVEMPKVSIEPLQAWFLFPFYKFILSPNGMNLFRTDFDKYKPLLSILMRAYEEFQEPGWNNNDHSKEMVGMSILISKLFFDSNRLIELFSTQEEITKMIEQLRVVIEEYIELSGGQPTHGFLQIHSDIMDLNLM